MRLAVWMIVIAASLTMPLLPRSSPVTDWLDDIVSGACHDEGIHV